MKNAVLIACCAGLLVTPPVAGARPSQSALPPTESNLARNEALVRDWAGRLQSDDPKIRVTAEAALVEGAARSLPLLRRFLTPEHEDLHTVASGIIRRIGPPAIPLLVDLLRDEWGPIRRNAADTLIDLAPHTEGIQPALRRALRDEDAMVAGEHYLHHSSSRRSRTRIRTSASTRRRPWRRSVRARPRRQAPWRTPWAIRFPVCDGRRARPSGASERLHSRPCRS